MCSKSSRVDNMKSVHNRSKPAMFVRTAQGLSSNQNEVAINSKSDLWRTALLVMHSFECKILHMPTHDACISMMNWPARSPDLNPIEHTWNIISRRIRQRPHHPENLRNLIDALVQEWQTIQQKVIRSMPCRCQECENDRGGHTSYS